MPHRKQYKICDPLYDYIYLDSGEKSLVDQELFQRLRSIQQLGFSEKAFPSGTGNRFCHSLGAFHLAGLAFDSIFDKDRSVFLRESKKKQFRKTLTISALLHDIGHGPLSHSSEALLPDLKKLHLDKYLKTKKDRQARHEDYNVKLIMEEQSLAKAIQQAGAEPSAVAQLLHGEFSGAEDFFIEKKLNFLPLLRQIISSDFDVDRMDYLQRDSLLCGVKYGLLDIIWLLSHFDLHIKGNQAFLAIGKEALYTLESFILGREHMRMVVYCHHKSLIYNEMLKKYAEQCDWRLPHQLKNYTAFTDSRFFDHLREDKNPWAKRITKSRPYIRLYEYIFFDSDSSRKEGEKIFSMIKNILKEARLDFIDTNSKKNSIKTSKTTLKKYPIYLKNQVLNQAQLLDQSPSLRVFPSRKIQRIYVEPESFSKAKALLKKMKAPF